MTPDQPGGAAPGALDPHVEEMVHPKGVQNGVMQVDADLCTGCGRCVLNCPYDCLEVGDDGVAHHAEGYLCFSCGNCTVACTEGAISMARPYAVYGGGYFDADYPEYTLPLPPRDANGDLTEWTETERVIIERRSVRNYTKDPVPETLIRRVLEAGRFAPSGGNHQPWKFTVVTDPALIAQLEERIQAGYAADWGGIGNEEVAPNLVGVVPDELWEPRVKQGLRSTALKILPVFLNAPVAIFIGAHNKMAKPILQAGVCGQNMNIAACAMGLGFVWSNFASIGVERDPELKAMMGFGEDWTCAAAACIGYPAFTQRGIVPRHNRPVTWFRPGADGPAVEA